MRRLESAPSCLLCMLKHHAAGKKIEKENVHAFFLVDNEIFMPVILAENNPT